MEPNTATSLLYSRGSAEPTKYEVLYNVIQDLKVGHERQRVTYSQLAFGRIRQRSTSKVYRAVL